ncbi:MAG: peptidase U32 family protein, partial [Bacteroidales bacterium]
MSKKLELLSPAKNLEYGKAAISHGADAVYIGAPKFGARQNAAASLDEIAQLIKYAHLYKAKVYIALNTILYENELEQAQSLIKQLYEMGADALIIQDLGLLACDLPPIELHASTQCHIADVDKLRFIESLGFKRAILARELSLTQIKECVQASSLELESFVHGALCVSYSGQCYMSHAISGRSGNRGECTQACRSMYDLYNESGKLLAAHSYLLSLKDLNASAYLQSMIEAGVSSFKIEGRLKDIYYLKNITAYYRKCLDALLTQMPEYEKASSGKTDILFTPDPDKTFHRPYTSYFLNERTEKTASMLSQKSIGKSVATVMQSAEKYITIKTEEEIIPGDGLCFFNENGLLTGFGVNRKQGNRIYPQTEVMP